MKGLFVLLAGALSSCAIEKPDYQTVSKEGSFEVRKYSSIPIVSAPMDDMENRNQSFRKLFKYIRGENSRKTKISMTAPVFMDQQSEADTKTKSRMSFMIPAEVAKTGAPSPDATGVSLDEIQSGTFAVLRFKGWEDETARKDASAELDGLISAQKLSPIGQKFFAFYNPPITPEFLRRNEIWQRVENVD